MDEDCPQLMFNSGYRDEASNLDTSHMRSILFTFMLKEVERFCQQTMQWSDMHSQVFVCV